MNSQSKSSAFRQVMAKFGIFGSLSWVIGELMAWRELAQSKYSAALMISGCAILGIIIASGITYFNSRAEKNGSKWKIEVQGKGGYSTFAVIALIFCGYGFFAHPLVAPDGDASKPSKLRTLTLEKPVAASNLKINTLIPYRNELIRVPGKFYQMVQSLPFDSATSKFSVSFGPGKDIDTGFVFLVNKTKTERTVTILNVARTKDGSEDLIVTVPQARKGSYLILLIRCNADIKIYPGAIK